MIESSERWGQFRQLRIGIVKERCGSWNGLGPRWPGATVAAGDVDADADGGGHLTPQRPSRRRWRGESRLSLRTSRGMGAPKVVGIAIVFRAAITLRRRRSREPSAKRDRVKRALGLVSGTKHPHCARRFAPELISVQQTPPLRATVRARTDFRAPRPPRQPSACDGTGADSVWRSALAGVDALDRAVALGLDALGGAAQ